MPITTNTSHPKQLYAKRRFLQVNDGEQLVRVVRKEEHPKTGAQPRRLIRLIPVVASISDKYKNIVEKLTKEEFITTHEEINIEKNIKEKTNGKDVQRHTKKGSDATLNAVNESLALLLSGQERIGTRLDTLKREQDVNRQQLEEGLKNVIEELKAELSGKSLEQTAELEKLRTKQSRLYDDFNLLNNRLDEMEHLVSKLLQESGPGDVLIRVPELQKPATIEEVSDDDESLHSVLSISSGSVAEGPIGPVKKTRKPSQAFLFTQRAPDPPPKNGSRKSNHVEITRF
ncbi:hypothetical protein Q1695_000659 [Nippostrongylus brasiliensis]|nr:hypothetical protein Q1695_000659 [Nippostrongylus brasiliensis]